MMNSTASPADSVPTDDSRELMLTVLLTSVNASVEEWTNMTLPFINISSTVTDHSGGNDSSQVVVPITGIESLVNVLIALMLALLILTTAIGK